MPGSTEAATAKLSETVTSAPGWPLGGGCAGGWAAPARGVVSGARPSTMAAKSDPSSPNASALISWKGES